MWGNIPSLSRPELHLARFATFQQARGHIMAALPQRFPPCAGSGSIHIHNIHTYHRRHTCIRHITNPSPTQAWFIHTWHIHRHPLLHLHLIYLRANALSRTKRKTRGVSANGRMLGMPSKVSDACSVTMCLASCCSNTAIFAANGSRRGYNANKRTQAAQIAAQNGMLCPRLPF
jgi:hypothetical protein